MKIQIEHLNKSYQNHHVLKNINLNVESQECLALIGPSGVGKTTLLRILTGLDKEYTGHIFFDDICVDEFKPSARKLGIVFQDYALYPHLNAAANIGLPLKFNHVDQNEIDRRVIDMAKLCHIETCLDHYPSQLSGGQKQRVALARALINQPELLLLDEPFSNLDAKLKESLSFEIKNLQKQLHLTVILITHDFDEAAYLADRIAILNSGQIEQIGTYDIIYNHPETLFVADFLNKNNHLIYTGRIQDGWFIWDNTKCKISVPFLDCEHITMVMRADALNICNQGSITMKADGIINHGNQSLVNLNWGDVQFRTSIKNVHELKDGQQVQVNFDLNKIYFFNNQNKLVR